MAIVSRADIIFHGNLMIKSIQKFIQSFIEKTPLLRQPCQSLLYKKIMQSKATVERANEVTILNEFRRIPQLCLHGIHISNIHIPNTI